jgi:hypothetical protein
MKIMAARAKRVTSLHLSIFVLAALTATSVSGQTRQTSRTDFGSVLKAGPADLGAMHADATALRQEIEEETMRFAGAAQTFGSRLTAAERRDLQDACESVVASEDNARMQRGLQSLLARYETTASETVLRFCLDSSYARLRNEIAATVSALERMRASGAEAQANIEIQNSLQRQQRTFTTLSNIMKTKHDTAKNSVSNVR